MRGTIEARGGRYSIRFERQLAHPPDKVWRALTENGELAHWFPATIEGERAAGAPLRFVWGPDVGPPPDAEIASVIASAQASVPEDEMRGVMRIYDPPRLLELTWHDEVLRFELAARDGGTHLVFTHTLDKKDIVPSASAGWDVCFDALTRRLDGAPPQTATKATYDRLTAEYTADVARLA
jgi:uncharacterized protein YndB with AHSA1/START domain